MASQPTSLEAEDNDHTVDVTNAHENEVTPQVSDSRYSNMTPRSDLSSVTTVAPFNEDTCREIIYQVEFYFSDQNLPFDRHLLGLAGGDGNGIVSLNEVLGWRKMREYKPKPAVKEVLSQSAVLDITHNGNRVKRRFPLLIRPYVKPVIDLARRAIEEKLAANPHLTKNMLRPTGFETNFAEPPITPQQYERDRKLYNPEDAFEWRIEYALRHYRSKRKMHQTTLRPFQLWMLFGGIDTAPNAYTGGIDEDELAELDEDEIAARRFTYSVDEYVLANEDKYRVDFEEGALAFLSTEFPVVFRYDLHGDIGNVCNVMVNFFNFLLHHDVCPEYGANLMQARRAVQRATIELLRLPAASKAMLESSRTFNQACSVLHRSYRESTELTIWDTVYGDEMSIEDATAMFMIGLAAFATEKQLEQAVERVTTWRAERKQNPVSDDQVQPVPSGVPQADNQPRAVCQPLQDITLEVNATADASSNSPEDETASDMSKHSPFQVICAGYVGLEVTSIQFASSKTSEYFDTLSSTGTPRMGILWCRKFDFPDDISEHSAAAGQPLPAMMKFIMEESTLEACYMGMKIQAMVKQLDIGLFFLEKVLNVYPSFYRKVFDTKAAKKAVREAARLERKQQRFAEKKAAEAAAMPHDETEQSESVDSLNNGPGSAEGVACLPDSLRECY